MNMLDKAQATIAAQTANVTINKGSVSSDSAFHGVATALSINTHSKTLQ